MTIQWKETNRIILQGFQKLAPNAKIIWNAFKMQKEKNISLSLKEKGWKFSVILRYKCIIYFNLEEQT